MTRINLISVSDLTDEHLLAEHRELKRIPSMIWKEKVNLDNIPPWYVLWKWHVKFFYNKLSFLKKRYIELYQECLKRWFQVQNYIENFDNIPQHLFWDFLPTRQEIEVSRQRIQEKLDAKPSFYRHYGKKISGD